MKIHMQKPRPLLLALSLVLPLASGCTATSALLGMAAGNVVLGAANVGLASYAINQANKPIVVKETCQKTNGTITCTRVVARTDSTTAERLMNQQPAATPASATLPVCSPWATTTENCTPRPSQMP